MRRLSDPDGRRRPPFLPAPRLILFDLDDTLCDYAAARAGRLRHAFTMHLPNGAGSAADHLIRTMISDSNADSPHGADHFPELFARHGLPPTAAADAADWYRRHRYHGLELFAGVRSTLQALRTLETADGAAVRRQIGIITNGPTQVQREKVHYLGIGPLVDFVVISGEFGVEKPDPSIYHEALRLGRAAAADSVFVGDNPGFDIMGAHNAGIRSVWMNRTSAPWPAHIPPPTREVSSLPDLIEVLG